MESWAWREVFALVFDSKGLISKYSGIRTYEIPREILSFAQDFGSTLRRPLNAST
jgi:hypothetical protein